ncbi:DUF4212 domain-containing protein [Cupriavidus sp. AU9028]|uniref:DUF4212 domain-containing protein n=1 Tax=Cupriavidus sp. AU9028 TaxID=2871157 RepID=UPI001C956AC2|nr:DUF4212 domain-containing protein [Cupriavidus sp. AU9028]MBY4895422.1 DUF4212 domain-containing protein [Cupriavidus sp. AU9028]
MPDLGPHRPATAPWKVNLRWTVALLALWFGSTFCLSWYARELRFDFFGWPFSFWAGAQGLLLLYVAMAAIYAWRMNRADRLAGAEPEAHGHGDEYRHDSDAAASRPGRGH